MQCPACGYTKEVKTEKVEEVVYFVSGPRKGQVKGTKEREIFLNVGDEEFEQEKLITGICKPYYNDYSIPFTRATLDFNSIQVNICPKCGTLFKEKE